jgi:hypothetical protein
MTVLTTKKFPAHVVHTAAAVPFARVLEECTSEGKVQAIGPQDIPYASMKRKMNITPIQASFRCDAQSEEYFAIAYRV